MKRTLLLALAILVSILLLVNSTKRLLGFRTTTQIVMKQEERLEQLKREHEALKKELEYKMSDEFAEGEIRDKLGLVKEGEAIVVLPEKDGKQQPTTSNQRLMPNWEKWWSLFFGSELAICGYFC